MAVIPKLATSLQAKVKLCRPDDADEKVIAGAESLELRSQHPNDVSCSFSMLSWDGILLQGMFIPTLSFEEQR
jgi:hypothetical protein